MLCCLVAQLQAFDIGVTTNNPDTGPLPHWLGDIDSTDKCWDVMIGTCECTTFHTGLDSVLQQALDSSPGNTFGLSVLETGELHLYHNGRDVGWVWKGLPTDGPLWGFANLHGCWKVEANYIIPKGEAVTCEVVCGVMFVSCNICACYCHLLYFALHIDCL